MAEQAPAATPTESSAINGPVIQTVSGLYVNPLAMRVEDVRLEDIAHHLAHQTRFSGATRDFYSVAEHSVRVAGVLQDQGFEPLIVLHGLLHDASEAYLIDLPRPLKSHPIFGKLYREYEAKCQAVIMEAFGLDTEEPPAVKVADNILLGTERRDQMPVDGREWEILAGVPTLPLRIHPLSPKRARDAFLATAHQLLGQVFGPGGPLEPQTDDDGTGEVLDGTADAVPEEAA